MASYPGSVPAKPSINTADMSAATSHTVDRGLQWDEIRAICIELGLTPSGSFSTVRARLDDQESDIADMMPRSGGAFTGAVSGITPVSTNHLATKGYVDGEVAGRVADTGDTITGAVVISVASGDPLTLKKTGSAPYLDFDSDANALLARISATASEMVLDSQSDLAFESNNTERARIVGTAFLFGKTSSNLDNDGVEIYGTGSSALGAVRSTTSATSLPNFDARHMSSADANTQPFARFTRTSSATTIGTITQDSTTGVLYNVTSDARLKTDVGLRSDDGLGTLERVTVRRYERSDGVEHVGVFAQELADVIPQAVTVGGDDPETDPWQVAYSAEDVIGHLLLAVQQLSARVAELENAG